MPKKSRDVRTTAALGPTLASLRAKSGLSQAEVARRMATTQTAIARLEAGKQSPSMRTLQDYARATGFCLEIGFVRSAGAPVPETGCMLVVQDFQGEPPGYDVAGTAG